MNTLADARQNSFWRGLAALTLFGVSFGYVEAALVVYLREIYEPFTQQLDPDRQPGEIYPLITLEQLEAAGTSHLALLKIEVIREASTMIMLASVGLAVGWNFNTCFAGFIVAFGVWDIFYYVFLRVLVTWPVSLLDWDILFLIPLPWVGPVLAPMLIAISMIVAGTIVLWRESGGRPVRISWWHWSVIVLGGITIVVSFCWDFRNVMAGGMPNPFQWPIFVVGETVGLGGFALALRNRQSRS